MGNGMFKGVRGVWILLAVGGFFPAFASAELAPLVGRKVMVLKAETELGVDNDVLHTLQRGEVYTVGRVNNAFLWLNEPAGWVSGSDVAPLEEAIRKFTAELGDKPAAPLLNLRGRAQANLGRFEQALTDLNESLRLDPKSARAFQDRGNVWHKRGDLQKALADYDQALLLNPRSAMTLNDRGLLRAEQKDFDAALRDADAAVALDPKYAAAYNNRGVYWREQGDFQRALADYDRALKLDPRFAVALGNRGYARKQLGAYAEALADYAAALKLDPNQWAAYNDSAWLLATCPDERLRNGAQAVERARRACDLTHFKEWTALDTLAAAYAETGEFPEAVKWAKKALELAPEEARSGGRDLLSQYEAGQPHRAP